MSKKPRPKKMTSLRARYDGQGYQATVHRQMPDGSWAVEKMSCLCSEKAEEDVKFLLAEIDRLQEYIEHLQQHHMPCEGCVEYVTP